MAPVLDALLRWRPGVRDFPPEEVLQRGTDALEARKEATEYNQGRLKVLVQQHRPRIEAARASAALLDTGQAEQIRKEISAEERAARQDLELLGRRMGNRVLAERLVVMERFSGTAPASGVRPVNLDLPEIQP
jgi:hypothetical protein